MTKLTKNLFIILLVIIIIIVIISFVLVSPSPFNPLPRRIPDANNGRRYEEVSSILDATQQYIVDHEGILPGCKGKIDNQLPQTATCLGTAAQCCDLSDILVGEGYLSQMPKDPKQGTPENTGYTVLAKEDEVICISAPYAEISQSQINACTDPIFLFFVIGLMIWVILAFILQSKPKTALIMSIIILITGIYIGHSYNDLCSDESKTNPIPIQACR